MFHRKVPLVGAGIAFLLSAIAGVAGGAPVPTLLLRALIGGAIFAVLTAAALELVRRHLPELFTAGNGGTPGGGDASEAGTRVDIVLPEEQLHEFDYSDEGDDEAENETEDFAGEFAEEVTEYPEGQEETENSRHGEEDVSGSRLSYDDERGDVDELVTDGQSGALPDLDIFVDAFSGSAGSADEGPDGTGGGSAAGGDQDPAVMAKAVRTILRKDQEGKR